MSRVDTVVLSSPSLWCPYFSARLREDAVYAVATGGQLFFSWLVCWAARVCAGFYEFSGLGFWFEGVGKGARLWALG